jgi:HEAT repeat protein
VRYTVASAVLGKIDKDANDAIPNLIAALKDPDRYVRTHAAEALQKIDPSIKF